MDSVVYLFVFLDFLLHMSLIDARSCFFPGEGEKKFYICTKNEYCCSYGCCLSPSFQFYQLWYYWLMVIFMFLLCSGGGWWYRYWLHDRYPSEFSNSLHSHQVGRPCPRTYRPARITYHPARETIILHHVWKGPGHSQVSAMRTSPPPPYHQNDGTPIIANGGSLQTSPYHQIYGPPPSYDSVIAGTSGSAEVNGLADSTLENNLPNIATTIPALPSSVSRILSGILINKINGPTFSGTSPLIDISGNSIPRGTESVALSSSSTGLIRSSKNCCSVAGNVSRPTTCSYSKGHNSRSTDDSDESDDAESKGLCRIRCYDMKADNVCSIPHVSNYSANCAVSTIDGMKESAEKSSACKSHESSASLRCFSRVQSSPSTTNKHFINLSSHKSMSSQEESTLSNNSAVIASSPWNESSSSFHQSSPKFVVKSCEINVTPSSSRTDSLPISNDNNSRAPEGTSSSASCRSSQFSQEASCVDSSQKNDGNIVSLRNDERTDNSSSLNVNSS